MKTYTAKCIEGASVKYRKVTIDRPLKYAPYAQAGFWGCDDCIYLLSYASCVFKARHDEDGAWYIEPREVRPSYSRTTSKHVTLALRELGMTDKEIAACKKALNDGFCYVW